MMDGFTTRLSNTLREKLTAEAHDVAQKLLSVAVPEYADYRERVGYAKGLRRAAEILSEVEKTLGRAEDFVERIAPRRETYES